MIMIIESPRRLKDSKAIKESEFNNNTKKLSLLVIPFSAVIGDEESRVDVTLTT